MDARLSPAPAGSLPVAGGATPQRRRLRVRGTVQGVGFRPWVFRLAHELALTGSVCNDGAGVLIEVQGAAALLDRFDCRLRTEAPVLARIEAIEAEALPADTGATGFHIAVSGAGPVATAITADAATCPDCLADLCEAGGRRWRYAFTNCTNCGPRFTITAALPYDRPNTSMAGFIQCPLCAAEYTDPHDRRFHAQPNACPACGPQLTLLDPAGAPLADADADPLAAAWQRIAAGQIVALKGLGGFQLVCDARNAGAVARLRQRKHRDEKPFAIMLANPASLAGLVHADAAAISLLQSPARPIVLLPKATGCDAALPGVAPTLGELGVMLPTAPVHWLLFHEAAGRPAGTAWCAAPQALALVMTSANPGGEPLVIDNTEAVARLGGIADALLVHDRAVLVRCDDSVVRARAGGPAFIRRARGYTPAAIALADDGPAVLGLGAWLKNTACLTRGAAAVLSQHIGDLDHAASCLALDEAVQHLQTVLQLRPQAVAHDLHPDFHSTRLAAALADAWHVPLVPVQHHHAHVAAVVAEHRQRGAVLGLALDGVGHGSDGGLWGGELLRVDGAQCLRLGHLSPLALPGGDRAAREPWRMAAAALHAAGRGDAIGALAQPTAPALRDLLDRGVRCPPTSSLGRWFDAAAGLLGVASHQSFEGQAAMRLEALARSHGAAPAWHDGWVLAADGTLDLRPLVPHLADAADPARAAARFHATLARALADWALAAAASERLDTIALGGGCLMNQILAHALREHLEAAGLRVLEAAQAPPNDGGISLGQCHVARAVLAH